MEIDLARLIVRHRHVAPMLSALLSGTNAGVRIRDAAGTVILEREAGGIGFESFPLVVDGEAIGAVEGDRTGRAIAAVLSYAIARESDKRSLAREALDRYRELNLVYELADRLSGELDLEAVVAIVVGEASKLPGGGQGFLLIRNPDGALERAGGAGPGPADAKGGGILGAIADAAVAEEVNDVGADPRASDPERAFASIVAAPLVARGRTLGVVGAASSTPVTYQAADLKLISAIAAIAAPAIAQSETAAEPGRAPSLTVG